MKILIPIFLFGLFSCAPKSGSIPFIPQSEVEKAQSVSPALSSYSASVKEADIASAIVSERVDSAARQSLSLQSSLDLAIENADKLRKQKAATEKDLEEAWASLNSLGNQARNLFNELNNVKEALSTEQSLRRFASSQLDQVKEIANKKDAEADLLRLQLVDSEESGRALSQSLLDSSKSLKSETTRADKAEQRASIWFWSFVASFTLLVLCVFWIIRF